MSILCQVWGRAKLKSAEALSSNCDKGHNSYSLLCDAEHEMPKIGGQAAPVAVGIDAYMI